MIQLQLLEIAGFTVLQMNWENELCDWRCVVVVVDATRQRMRVIRTSLIDSTFPIVLTMEIVCTCCSIECISTPVKSIFMLLFFIPSYCRVWHLSYHMLWHGSFTTGIDFWQALYPRI